MSINKGNKPAYTREFGEKSRGLFSPDDWTCKNCHNINWARRTTCNMCGTRRFNNLGERTGYGGGFMERDEVVEYRGRRSTDSDDEFDEFGRKKKRFRQATDNSNDKVTSRSSPSLHSPSETGQETSDEDEASGDDADLSKYAIWSGDEDTDKGDPTSKNDVNGKGNQYGSSVDSDSSDSSTSSDTSSASSSGSARSHRSQRDSSSSGDEEPRSKRTNRQSRESNSRDRSRFEWAALSNLALLSSPLSISFITQSP